MAPCTPLHSCARIQAILWKHKSVKRSANGVTGYAHAIAKKLGWALPKIDRWKAPPAREEEEEERQASMAGGDQPALRQVLMVAKACFVLGLVMAVIGVVAATSNPGDFQSQIGHAAAAMEAEALRRLRLRSPWCSSGSHRR
ncbi:hypothetical protein TRIUR3_11320 [Triticum urartu]|uniref:Uncharacterized protein n=1 Tax=Triticum urartu TaxID=4572 RepID=M8AQF6_TRIUA|nr:hypothetical protein TRIUR3_11320 [Triticum urartu]